MLSGAVQVQLRGKGAFVSAHAALEESRLTLSLKQQGGAASELRCASTVGIRISSPKTARDGHPYAFRVDLAVADNEGASKYIISAASAAEQAKWMKALRAASKRGPPRQLAGTGPARIGAARAPASNSARRHEGCLMRRRTPRSDWEQRWIRLDDAGLAVFERKGGSRQDFLPLRQILKARPSQAPRTSPTDFELEVLSTDRTWRLRALSAAEIEGWIDALSRAISAASHALHWPEPEPEPESTPRQLGSTKALVRQSSILGTPHLNTMVHSSPGEVGRSLDNLWGTSARQRSSTCLLSASEAPAAGGEVIVPRSDSAGAAAVSTTRHVGRSAEVAGPSTFPERGTAVDGVGSGVARAGGAPRLLKRTKSECGIAESGDREVLRQALQEHALFEPLAMDRTGAGFTALLVGAEIVTLGAGRLLYSAGDLGAAAECAYVVKSGTIIVTPIAAQHRIDVTPTAVPFARQRPSAEKGRPQVLRTGALFGVEALLCDAPRCATATAGGDTNTQVWAIRRELYTATASAASSSVQSQPQGGGKELQWGGGTSCAEEIAHQLHRTYPAFSFLRRVKLFGTLTLEQLGSVAAAMIELPFSRGQPLLVEAEPSRGLFVVRTGKVIVRPSSTQEASAELPVQQRSKSSPGLLGRQTNRTSQADSDKCKGPFSRSLAGEQASGDTCIAELTAGDYFGERELRDGSAVSNTIEGGSDCGRLLWLPPADFQRLLSPLEKTLPWRDVSAADGVLSAQQWYSGQEAANSLTWRVEEFEKLGQLGAGAFGQVIAVRERATGDLYALKALNKRHLIVEDAVDEVYKERNMLAEIGHCRFIANMRGYTQDSSKLYFLLELATGGDLRAALSRHLESCAGGVAKRGLSLEAVRHIGAELTLALEHIHKHNVVYRDLKPENALLTADGHVKLTDFGLARSLTPGTRTFTHAGTDPYLPPELLQNLGTASGMDWWALGVTMFELRVGTTPFELLQRPKTSDGYGEPTHIYYLIMRKEPKFPEWVRAEASSFVQLLKGLLRKDYATRLGNGAGGAEDIKQHEFFAEDIDWSAAANEISWPSVPGLGGQTAAQQLEAVTDNAHGLRTEALAEQHAAGKVTEKEQRLFDDFSGYWEDEDDVTTDADDAACTVQ